MRGLHHLMLFLQDSLIYIRPQELVANEIFLIGAIRTRKSATKQIRTLWVQQENNAPLYTKDVAVSAINIIFQLGSKVNVHSFASHLSQSDNKDWNNSNILFQFHKYTYLISALACANHSHQAGFELTETWGLGMYFLQVRPLIEDDLWVITSLLQH